MRRLFAPLFLLRFPPHSASTEALQPVRDCLLRRDTSDRERDRFAIPTQGLGLQAESPVALLILEWPAGKWVLSCAGSLDLTSLRSDFPPKSRRGGTRGCSRHSRDRDVTPTGGMEYRGLPPRAGPLWWLDSPGPW